MKRIIIVLIVIAFGSEIFSQAVTVVETKQITNSNDGEFYFPHFSRDDSKIIFTKSNYIGLYQMNIKSKNIKEITIENGAGYKPLVSSVSDDIFYKSFIIKDGRKFNSLKKYDLNSNTIEVIEQDKRLLSLPNQTNSAKISYLVNSEMKKTALQSEKLLKINEKSSVVYVENNKLYLNENNSTKEFSPLGEGVYVWESFSNDAKNIVFTFGNKGAFVFDLKGKIIKNIPNAHYPKFSPNGKYLLYMVDEDNGHSYTSSDIYIYSFEEDKSYPITNTENKIEMYAEWSNKGNSIVYHTEDGEIYTTKLNIEN